MVVANGDGTLAALTQGVTIDPNSGTITANSAVVTGGLNAKVTQSIGQRHDLFRQGYNATTQAGAVSGIGGKHQHQERCHCYLQIQLLHTNNLYAEVAAGNGLNINSDGELEVITSGNNIILNNDGSFSALTPPSFRTVTATGNEQQLPSNILGTTVTGFEQRYLQLWRCCRNW